MMKRPGFTIRIDELVALGVEPRVGARFITDRLDVARAEFEVLNVEGYTARVQRIAWAPSVSGTMPAVEVKPVRTG